MKKTILSLLAAGAVGVAGVAAAPQQAHAVVWWVAPAIIGSAIVGVGAGAAADNAAHSYAYEPRGSVYVAPTGCHFVNQRIHGHWRTVQVCN